MKSACVWMLVLLAVPVAAQTGVGLATGETDATLAPRSYVLGPNDQLLIRVVDIDEVPDKPFRIDVSGKISVPIIGQVTAAGLTVEQFEADLRRRFEAVLRNPTVTVFIAEFRSQPVSVLGAVRNPGAHQIRGSTTLFEVLSLAGGLNPDAGNTIKITRRKSAGGIALPSAKDDTTSQFQVAEVSVKSVMEAANPQENIAILPQDVVSVPKGALVYVIGAVHRSGGFVLSEKEKVSVLQALAFAEGLDRTSAPTNARILRPVAGSDTRREIQVNVKRILSGQSGDISLLADDILFIPTSGPKTAMGRGVEAAIAIGTGLAIYRR